MEGALEALRNGRAISRLHEGTLALARDRTLGEKVSSLSAEIERLEGEIQALIHKAGEEEQT